MSPMIIYCERCNQRLVSKLGDLCEDCKKAVRKQRKWAWKWQGWTRQDNVRDCENGHKKGGK